MRHHRGTDDHPIGTIAVNRLAAGRSAPWWNGGRARTVWPPRRERKERSDMEDTGITIDAGTALSPVSGEDGDFAFVS
jgi:hypothetical protein